MNQQSIYKKIKKLLHKSLRGLHKSARSASNRGVDKNTSLRYNGGQAPLSFFAAVMRRLYQKLKGYLKSVVPRFYHIVPFGTRRSVMKTQHVSFHGRSLAAFATTLIAAAILSACGGGGSGVTTVTPPPPPTPVAGNLSITASPANGATGVARDSKVVLTYASSTNSYASSTATLTCDGTSIALAQSTDQATKKVTFAPASVFPYGKTCISQGTSTASGLDGGASTTIPWSTTFVVEQLVCSKIGEQVSADGQTCVPVATSWWQAASIVLKGQWLYLDKATAPAGTPSNNIATGQTLSGMLPSGCVDTQDGCWQQATRDGVIKYVNSDAIDPPTGIKVAWAMYRVIDKVFYPGTTLYCVRPVLTTDGTYGIPLKVEANWCGTSQIIAAQGGSTGVVYQEKNTSGQTMCFGISFKASNNAWSTIQVACPN